MTKCTTPEQISNHNAGILNVGQCPKCFLNHVINPELDRKYIATKILCSMLQKDSIRYNIVEKSIEYADELLRKLESE